MINIKNRRCKVNGCILRPHFNHKNEVKAMYCRKHKTVDMADVVSKQCQVDGCTKRPLFGFENGDKATHCKAREILFRFVDTLANALMEETIA